MDVPGFDIRIQRETLGIRNKNIPETFPRQTYDATPVNKMGRGRGEWEIPIPGREAGIHRTVTCAATAKYHIHHKVLAADAAVCSGRRASATIDMDSMSKWKICK